MTQVETTTQFFFSAVSADGSRKRGMRTATDEPSLAQALSEDGLLLVKARKLPSWTARTTDLPLKDQVGFNRQIGDLLGRGVTLVEALEVAGSVVTPATKKRSERIRSLVGAGASFADACEQVGGFDSITITVYRSAERAGDLGDAARRLAESAERRQAIVGKAITLLIYPAIVSAISAIVATLVLTIVVPKIGAGLAQTGIELPWYTELVMDAGNWLKANFLFVLIGLVAFASLLVVFRKIVFAALLALLRKMPAVSKLVLAMESARFFSVMGAMARSGVPLADSLGIASGAVSHPQLRKQLETVRTRLVEGGVLRQLLEEVTALPLATRRLLVAAERSGDLDSAFDALAVDLTNEMDTRSERLLAALEPALIVVMFVVIGSLLMSVMVPLVTMSSQVQG